ncbi:uncharacterized protein LOC144746845 [Ciona intestinalis]
MGIESSRSLYVHSINMIGFTESYDVTTMNVTGDVTIVPKTKKIQFFVPLTIEAIIASCSLWLVVRLIFYGVKKKRFRQRHKADVNGGILYSFVVLSAVMLFGRCCSSILFLLLPSHQPGYDVQCNQLFQSGFFILTVTMCSVFASLWLRQRALYANPLLANSQSKLVTGLSRFSVLFIPFVGYFYLSYYWGDSRLSYRTAYSGCIFVGGSIVALVPTGVAIIFFQLTLLVLFIIPLRRHLKICGNFSLFRKAIIRCMNKQESDTSSAGNSSQAGHVTDTPKETKLPEARIQIETNPSINFPTNLKVIRLLKRLTVVTAVCVASDVLGLILVTIIIQNYQTFFNFAVIIYDVNLLINVSSVIVSFNDYRKILFPCASTKCIERIHPRTVDIATIS